VTKSRMLVAVVGGLLATTVTLPAAWGQVSNARVQSNIALIDVGVIFKNHSRFKAFMADLQADAERAEAQIKKEKDTIRGLAERLNDYRSGTPEYKDLEEQIAKRQADLSVQVQLQRKEFLGREAKVYNMIYQEIWQEVNAYAAANGIAAVFKFNSEQPDPEKPEEVIRDLNKPVLWSASNLDITPVILESLNRRSLPSADNRGRVPFPSKPQPR
jgi:Skp family chaperone for outer membrane proteins